MPYRWKNRPRAWRHGPRGRLWVAAACLAAAPKAAWAAGADMVFLPVFSLAFAALAVGACAGALAMARRAARRTAALKRDLARQHGMEQALSLAEQHYRAIYDNALEGIFQCTMAGRFIRANPAMSRMLGYETPSRLVVEVVEPLRQLYADPADCGRLFQQVAEEGVVRGFECRLKRRDGGAIWVRLDLRVARDRGGEISHLDGFAEDVSDRKRAEEDAREQEKQLLQADKMISLGILTAGVAHEINNPNNFIALNTPIIRDVWQSVEPILDAHHAEKGDFSMGGLPYAAMREHMPVLLSGIAEGSERIRNIVTGMKNFARMDGAGMGQQVDMNEVLRAALTLMASKIKKSTHHFEVSYGQGLPTLRGNRQRLEQVLVNVLLNAAEALPDPSRFLRVATEYDADAGEVRVLVRDEGVGIASGDMERLFDPFFTTKRGMGGVGLGLSISLSIVKAHGGSFRLTSNAERGATASVAFPVHDAPDEGEREHAGED